VNTTPIRSLRPAFALAFALAFGGPGCSSIRDNQAPPTPTPAPPTEAERVGDAVIALLRSQVAAWNRGDLDAFLEIGYWTDDGLTFVSGGAMTRGFETVAARYRRRYLEEGATMGQLTFNELEVDTLAPGLARAIGRWDLVRDGDEPEGGRFTLLLRELDSGWRIVYDHTSAD